MQKPQTMHELIKSGTWVDCEMRGIPPSETAKLGKFPLKGGLRLRRKPPGKSGDFHNLQLSRTQGACARLKRSY